MALQLPANFEKDIQGRDTALVPVVTISTDALPAPIRISTNSITIDGNNFKPILLNIPSLKESIDVEKRNYKISSVNIDISNLPYEGKRFSELVGVTSLANVDCDIYWTSPSANTLDLSSESSILPIYHGIIRRYTHDDKKVRLVVEDRSQAALHKDLPTTSLGDDVPDKYKNKPIPMVYGHVDRSPLVLYSGNLFPDVKTVTYITGEYPIILKPISALYVHYEDKYVNIPDRPIESFADTYIDGEGNEVTIDYSTDDFQFTEKESIYDTHTISGLELFNSELLSKELIQVQFKIKPVKLETNTEYPNAHNDLYWDSVSNISNVIDDSLGTALVIEKTVSLINFNRPFGIRDEIDTNTKFYSFTQDGTTLSSYRRRLFINGIDITDNLGISVIMDAQSGGLYNDDTLGLFTTDIDEYNNGNRDFYINWIVDEEGGQYMFSSLADAIESNRFFVLKSLGNGFYLEGFQDWYALHSITDVSAHIKFRIKEWNLWHYGNIEKPLNHNFYANVKGRSDPVPENNRSTRQVFNITGFRTENDDDFEEVRPLNGNGDGIYDPFDISCGVRVESGSGTFDHHQGYCTDGDTYHYLTDAQAWDGHRQIKIEKWNWDFSEKLAIRGDIRPVKENGTSDIPIQVEGDTEGEMVPWGSSDTDSYPSSYSHPIAKHAYPTPVNPNLNLLHVNHMGGCCFLPNSSGASNIIIAGLERWGGSISNSWGSPQLIVFDADDLSVLNVSNLHGEDTYLDPELGHYSPSHMASAIAAEVDSASEFGGYLYASTYSDDNNQGDLPTDRTPVYELDSIFEANQDDTGRCNFVGYYDHIIAAEQEGNATPSGYGRIYKIQGLKYYNGFLYVTESDGYIYKLEPDHENKEMIIRGKWNLSTYSGTQGFDFYQNSDGDLRLRVLNDAHGHSSSTYGARSTLFDYGVEGSWEGGGDVEGCTDPLATNYDPLATVDDGSCEYVQGCTDENACNYDETAIEDDGSCDYGTECSDGIYECDSSDCPEEPDVSIGGCKDPYACNYDEDATYDDGSCIYVEDCAGICGGDTVIDDCGVCDGDNSTCDQTPDIEEGTYTGEAGGLIQKPSDIAYHLMDVELNGGVLSDKKNYSNQSSIEVSREAHSAWNLGFTVSKKINSKKLLEGLLASSKSFIRYNSMGEYGFVTLKDFNSSLEHDLLIMNDDIISFAYDRTKIEDVASSVIVEYNKDYARDEYVKLDPKTTDDLSLGTGIYETGYYGLEEDHSESEKTFSSDYIRDPLVAGKWQDFLLKWYCNQHLLIFVDLPLKYITIEVGDIVIFDKTVDVLPYGIDYTKDHTLEQVNGQEVYPQFLIYETNKQIDKVSVKCIQMHELNRNGDWDSDSNAVYGCTDPQACNYDETATKDDDSCEYADENYDCDDPDVAGCMDDSSGSYPDVNEEGAYLACNYNPDANVDDGSCMYDGCSDPDANNYIGEVCNNDGSCTYDCATGDANCDGGWNVLDIVILSNCVLNDTCDEYPQGDVNGDGGYNVLDIVTLVNCVLNNTCEG